MKKLIDEYYGINVIGMIKLTKNVYKLKTDNTKQFVVKIIDNKKIEKIYDYITAMHLKCFVPICLNKNNEIITPYNHHYFYIMPCIDNSQGVLKELKLKFYFETLAYLHINSFFYIKVNQDYFQTIHQDINSIIHEREIYYQQMIQNYESILYRSPSQWMLVMNYYRIYESLCQARQYLTQFIDYTKSFTQMRVCLTYKNFDYNHICLKERLLLSLDCIEMDLPIYDLFDMYQKIPDILFDLDCFSQHYFHKIEYKKEEKLLLCCLMSIVPIIYYSDDEIENIIKLSRLLYYIDSIHGFIESMSET
jgi:hypothetical protein